MGTRRIYLGSYHSWAPFPNQRSNFRVQAADFSPGRVLGMGQINRDERGCLHLKQPVEKVRVALPHPQPHIIPCSLFKKLL